MSTRVFCATLGCDKNLVDTEALLGRFARQGVTATDDLEAADIWILNSCGFIDASRRDSAETLTEMIRLKTSQTLMVFGCWSQEHGDMIRTRSKPSASKAFRISPTRLGLVPPVWRGRSSSSPVFMAN